MIDAYLTKKQVGLKLKIGVKSGICAGVIALAVILPQLVHLALGVSGGVQWLPMYLPVLLGGCLLGWKLGLAVGALSPVVSFLITLAFGNPMPALVRLPYMVAELAVFGAVSGAFSKAIVKNSVVAFPAVLLAAVSGRATFLAIVAIFQGVSPLGFAAAWAQVQTGLSALILQAVIVPAIVMLAAHFMNREKE